MSTKQVIKPKVRGFVCITAHPEGCATNVQGQIDYVKNQPLIENGPKKVLVIGASTGYGLASRVALAFGCKADTFGIFFERPSDKGRPASAGWYNSIAFEKAAQDDGLYAKSINGDAFSHGVKKQTIETLKAQMGPVDLVVYSLASPRRVDPDTGDVYRATIKPLGESFKGKSLDTDRKEIIDVSIEPASQGEIDDTVKVMGGEDWELWMRALDEANLLAPGATSVAYSYIGPDVTWAIYKNGTIGLAKENLEQSAQKISKMLQSKHQGKAFISINKALVTQASSAIPVVPLYISLLYKVMKEKGIHEGCIEQMHRLFATRLYNNSAWQCDEVGRVRIDDWEMRSEVQDAIRKLWPNVSTEGLDEFTDFKGYQEEFLKLFGFGFPSVDYTKEIEMEVEFPALITA